MIVPPLSALFPNPAIQQLGDMGPFFDPKAFHQLDKDATKPQKGFTICPSR